MINEKEINKIYELEKEIVKKGADFYYDTDRSKYNDYLKYITCIIKKLYNSCSLRFIWIIAVMRATNY